MALDNYITGDTRWDPQLTSSYLQQQAAANSVPVHNTSQASGPANQKILVPTQDTSGSGGVYYGASASSGSSGATKSSDSAQVSALRELLDSGFQRALDTRISNIERNAQAGDDMLLKGYGERLGSLNDLREDTEKAESTSSFINLSNRAREATDMLTEAVAQGAGETDQLRSQLMAVRNWAANQAEVNRSYFDSVGSNNAAVTELNADTRTARFNLATQALGDQEQAWATYQNQMVDAYTQLGNVLRDPNSDSYDASAADNAWADMANAASDVWENPGVSEEITEWEGDQKAEPGYVSNSIYAYNPKATAGVIQGFNVRKRPEGSTLQGW